MWTTDEYFTKVPFKETILLLILSSDKIFLVFLKISKQIIHFSLLLIKEITEVINDYMLIANNPEMSGEKEKSYIHRHLP